MEKSKPITRRLNKETQEIIKNVIEADINFIDEIGKEGAVKLISIYVFSLLENQYECYWEK